MERVTCRTPIAGRDGVTNIPAWKLDAICAAILDALSCGPVALRKLSDLVKARLSRGELARLGSVDWQTTSVKSKMEVRGEVERVPGKGPQYIKRVE